ncbi:conserved Plasmodium protein, unknown function [Plasmodium knowlesi strain H]|uniref:Uncharacterized protein n=3 Tax=Plasmodium knowlesi TaxID=5850 RepID=A0A5K1V7U9_PLAKH|nr:conserved Plasmodium protein, unknown function [Plasmodium knowlesi strain H]OTN67301.1 Uncharacterized protein PKNOH_S06413100 [Plasmodium knowlesi]CAA9987407.1 conserved Plasmodium protein, unknown function [Plasmodium knowlesi strain H]SBO23293.1 conserved Plasmodium protein, unknown function [Plasmodium knowlesi strain H]SBO24329.1 conserved Plasmodium protein, unknown function [Plasmodium knowlesi strain H]VVS76881.1 conserved Plasmodium protein, unknown function [Plasmodium knowlesi s|eukprot:XP_002258409.1 hypothetical protein, conserved in Plasmodium species [Plasmodium knowlesi strain H]
MKHVQKHVQFLLLCILTLLLSENKSGVNNLGVMKRRSDYVPHLTTSGDEKRRRTRSKCRGKNTLFLYIPKGNLWKRNVGSACEWEDRLRGRDLHKGSKFKRLFFERNGINVPQDVAMFGKMNIYYVRESVYDRAKNNLVPNEVHSESIEELEQDETTGGGKENGTVEGGKENGTVEGGKENGTVEGGNDASSVDLKNSMETDGYKMARTQTGPPANGENIFKYINQERDYIAHVGNSPKVDVYERRYRADEQKMQRMFENINEVNIQLLKDMKNIDEKEKLINKKVIQKVREDIKRFQEKDEIMDIHGNVMHPSLASSTSSSGKGKGKDDGKQKNDLLADMDEEEKNEVIKKLYMVEKKTDKYLEENVYLVMQTWLPDMRIDDTLIVIDNVEKFYNDFDIKKYHEKFNQAKDTNFAYDLNSHIIENVPNDINEDPQVECENVNSYNSTYNKLNSYNLKRYTYTYTTNDNMDTKFTKNEPLPPVVIINTRKNFMVQEWECKNFKNRQKRNKSQEYTRIQRAFRPFSYIDLSDITCIYKNNFLQLKMKMCHRKFKDDVYPFFVPINKTPDELLDFQGYKKNGDYAWSFFWHHFKYDQDTDYGFLNRNVKLNLTETKFENVNKKKSKKIMRKILKETKGV